jgi:hypothetical protein
MSPSNNSGATANARAQKISKHLNAPAPKNTMATEYKFEGWLGKGPEAATGQMVWEEYEPKVWTEDDVDIKVTHCGICGSDLHTLRSGWVSPSPSGHRRWSSY